jgi:cobalt/nickel transport system permease protein
VTGLAVDDAAWRSAWRRRAPGDKLLLCLGLILCALVLPVWPGSLMVGLTAVVLALGPARVPARTFGRAVRLPLTFVAIGALAAVVQVGGDGVGWAPDAGVQAGALVGHALAGGAAVMLLATTTPMSDLLPALCRLRVPVAVVQVASVVYRLLFVLLESLHTIREAQTVRMGYSSVRRSYRSSGTLAAAVLTRS